MAYSPQEPESVRQLPCCMQFRPPFAAICATHTHSHAHAVKSINIYCECWPQYAILSYWALWIMQLSNQLNQSKRYIQNLNSKILKYLSRQAIVIVIGRALSAWSNCRQVGVTQWSNLFIYPLWPAVRSCRLINKSQETKRERERVMRCHFPFWIDINFYLVIEQLSQSGPTLPCLHSNCELPTHTSNTHRHRCACVWVCELLMWLIWNAQHTYEESLLKFEYY